MTFLYAKSLPIINVCLYSAVWDAHLWDFTYYLSSHLKLKTLCCFSGCSLYSLTAPWFCNYSASTYSSIFWMEHRPHKVCSRTCRFYSHCPKQGLAASTAEYLRALKHTDLDETGRKHILRIYTYQFAGDMKNNCPWCSVSSLKDYWQIYVFRWWSSGWWHRVVLLLKSNISVTNSVFRVAVITVWIWYIAEAGSKEGLPVGLSLFYSCPVESEDWGSELLWNFGFHQ